MSSDEDDDLCRFGTPLDPIEEGFYYREINIKFTQKKLIEFK